MPTSVSEEIREEQSVDDAVFDKLLAEGTRVEQIDVIIT